MINVKFLLLWFLVLFCMLNNIGIKEDDLFVLNKLFNVFNCLKFLNKILFYSVLKLKDIKYGINKFVGFMCILNY